MHLARAPVACLTILQLLEEAIDNVASLLRLLAGVVWSVAACIAVVLTVNSDLYVNFPRMIRPKRRRHHLRLLFRRRSRI